ncbi:33 kDa chaperonin [Fibrobacterales bacterium]|nr:33 kDa chaperonin [Fibrobacterales bacterium]
MVQQDIIIRATGQRAPIRFVLVSVKNAMNEIGARHEAQGFALKFLAEIGTASLLLSSGLKFPGTVSLRLDSEGDIRFAQGDSTPQGLVRAMIPQDDLKKIGADEPIILPKKLSVIQLNEKSERVKESIVEAASKQMGVNLSAYLSQSEQTKSATGVLAEFDQNDPCRLAFAIGFLVEAYPDASQRDLEIMDAVVRNLPPLHDFYNGKDYQLHDLLDQLRGPYDIEIVREVKPASYCPCTKSRVLTSLSALDPSEITDIKQKGEFLDVVCDFCRTHYAIDPAEISQP